MRKFRNAGGQCALFLVCLLTGQASAQENGRYNWVGAYGGVHLGYGRSGSNISIAPADANTIADWGLVIGAGAQPTSLSSEPSGFLGGLQVGYNWRSGPIVYGVEADVSRSGVEDHQTVSNQLPGFLANVTAVASSLDWLSTIRARAGVLLSPELLLYATGGLAFGHVEHSFSGGFPAEPSLTSGSASRIETGWTVGAGAEYALSRTLTLRGEYLYYDLGDTKFQTQGGNPLDKTFFNAQADNSGHMLRAALNFKF